MDVSAVSATTPTDKDSATLKAEVKEADRISAGGDDGGASLKPAASNSNGTNGNKEIDEAVAGPSSGASKKDV